MAIWKPQAMRNRVRGGRENDSFLTLFRVAKGFQVAFQNSQRIQQFNEYYF